MGCRKLQELEKEVGEASRSRLKYAEGRTYCWCTVVLHSYVIPSYVRICLPFLPSHKYRQLTAPHS